MRFLVAMLVALSILATSVANADEYMVNNDGVYQLVFKFPPGSTVDGCDDNPDIPNPPPTGSVAERSKGISKAFLRNGSEAATVSLSITSASGKADPKKSLQANLTAAGVLFPGNMFTEWFNAISGLTTEANFSDAFLTQVNAGVVAAFTGDSAVEPAFDFLLIMKIVTCVIQNLPGNEGKELGAFDFQLILKIVGCVIGNLPGRDAEILIPIPETKPVIDGHIKVPTFAPVSATREFSGPSRDALWVEANREQWMGHKLKTVLIELRKLPSVPSTFAKAGL